MPELLDQVAVVEEDLPDDDAAIVLMVANSARLELLEAVLEIVVAEPPPAVVAVLVEAFEGSFTSLMNSWNVVHPVAGLGAAALVATLV